MALGAGSVTPMQMAAAYAVFANGGYRVNPLPDHARSPTTKGKVLVESPAAAARRVDARHRRAQRLHHGQPAAERGAARHRRARRRRRSSAPTCTARPAPPTTRSTPGSPASSRRMVGDRLDGLRHAAQAGRPRDRRRPEPADLDRLHGDRAQGRAGERADARPTAWSTSAASGTTTTTRRAGVSPAWASIRPRHCLWRRWRARPWAHLRRPRSATGSSTSSGSGLRGEGMSAGIYTPHPSLRTQSWNLLPWWR